MKSLSGVGLGLSLVFGCLLLALMAEIYYLLWWKKKTIHKATHDNHHHQYINDNGILQIHIPPTQRAQVSQLLTCCKNPTSNPTLVHDPQSSSSSSSSNNPFSKNNHPILETLPRLLFTITEETSEDLAESEDAFALTNNITKQSTNLGDLLQVLETPFLTPTGSPLYYTPPMTPTLGLGFHNHPNSNNNNSSSSSSSSNHQRFGQFFEAERDAAFNRMRASPPPKFKFLRDAEEKMIQRTRLIEQHQQEEKEQQQPTPESQIT